MSKQLPVDFSISIHAGLSLLEPIQFEHILGIPAWTGILESDMIIFFIQQQILIPSKAKCFTD